MNVYTIYRGAMVVGHFLRKKSALQFIRNTKWKKNWSTCPYKVVTNKVAPKGQAYPIEGQVTYRCYHEALKKDKAIKVAISVLTKEQCRLLNIYPI